MAIGGYKTNMHFKFGLKAPQKEFSLKVIEEYKNENNFYG